MKIVIITPFKNGTGGVETVNHLLSTIFSEKHWEVDYITTDNFQPTFWDRVFIKLVGLPYVTYKKSKTLISDYDVVICNGEFGFGIKHPHSINLFHGSYKGLRDYLRKQYSFWQYLALTKAMIIQKISTKGKYVVAVSEFIKNILEKNGIQVDKVITNCVNTNIFQPQNSVRKKQHLLFVGSYNYYAKGFDILENLATSGYKIDCVTDRDPGMQLSWLQNLPNSDMPRVYNEHKILLFPSRFEGASMVVLEAMACGVPVIINNVGIGPELRKEIPEFVILDNNRGEGFSKKIKTIEKKYDLYSLKARKYVLENHSYDEYKKEWVGLVEMIYEMGN